MNTEDTTRAKAHPAVRIEWRGKLEFDIGRPGGSLIRLDGDAKAGPGPFDAMLCSIAACASTDVVTMFEAEGTPLTSLSVNVDATRVGTPRRLNSAALRFMVRGKSISQAQADRIVSASITQLCGVRASLIGDASVHWIVESQS